VLTNDYITQILMHLQSQLWLQAGKKLKQDKFFTFFAS